MNSTLYRQDSFWNFEAPNSKGVGKFASNIQTLSSQALESSMEIAFELPKEFFSIFKFSIKSIQSILRLIVIIALLTISLVLLVPFSIVSYIILMPITILLLNKAYKKEERYYRFIIDKKSELPSNFYIHNHKNCKNFLDEIIPKCEKLKSRKLLLNRITKLIEVTKKIEMELRINAYPEDNIIPLSYDRLREIELKSKQRKEMNENLELNSEKLFKSKDEFEDYKKTFKDLADIW